MTTNLPPTATSSGTKLPQAEPRSTTRLEKVLPKGIAIGFIEGRSSPFYVRYGKARTFESFESEKARNVRVEQLILEREQNGVNAINIQVSQIRAWDAWAKEAGATLEQVKVLWSRYSHTLSSTILTKDAVARYLTLRLNEDTKEKTDTYRQMKKHLMGWLVGNFGERRLVDVTADDLRTLLSQVKNREGSGPAAAITKQSYRKNWNTFFGRAVREKWIPANPCEAVVPPKVSERDKDLLSIEDAFRLLKANLGQPILPRLALEMWGFMRASSASRISSDDWKQRIIYSERALFMPGDEHKSGKSKYRQRHPDVLWDWLNLATAETWALSERMCALRKSEAFVRAELRLTERKNHNVLRHSCISYHLAAFKDISNTSYLAQHSSIRMTQRYEGIARESQGKLWMKLTPAVVAGTWEQFLSSNQLTKAVE